MVIATFFYLITTEATDLIIGKRRPGVSHFHDVNILDRVLSKGDALHRRVSHARLVPHEGDALELTPGLPRHLQAPALVETRVARETHTGRLLIICRKEATTVALLSRMDVAAAARNRLAFCVLYREDAAGPVNTGLRRVELRRVKGGVFVPVDS